ncbi:MAG: HPr family phosphocarrier protein [bacterium]
MHSAKVFIQNKLGMHARSAAMFVEMAGRFQSRILIKKDDSEVNGKSIMGIMMLAAAKGTELILHADGPDEVEAIENLSQLVNGKFGEE